MWITAAIVLAILLIAVLALVVTRKPDEATLRNSQKSAMPYDSMYVSLDDNHPEHKEMK